MQSGFGLIEDKIDKELMTKIEAMLVTLLDDCIHVAVVYVNECGRNTITSTDMLYAVEYQAREFFKQENLIENIDNNVKMLTEAEEESDSDEETESHVEASDEETDEETDEESDSEEENFTRCENETNPIVKLMNEYHDSWNEWKPEDTYERLLKKVIDEKLCY